MVNMAEIDFVSIFAPKMTNIDIFEFWRENSKFRKESILGFTKVTKNARKKSWKCARAQFIDFSKASKVSLLISRR